MIANTVAYAIARHLRPTPVYEALLEQDGIQPVSYTHLRAHETVLDLVCRLLLEKKTTRENASLTEHTRRNNATATITTYHTCSSDTGI